VYSASDQVTGCIEEESCRFPAEARDFYFIQRIRAGYGTNLASYWGDFPEDKEAEV
jgi:hypothetical protein